MNGTRAFTKKYGRKQTIGRVQTPTLAMLTERQAKIQNFVKEPYYKVELSGAGVVAVSEQMAQEQQQMLCRLLVMASVRWSAASSVSEWRRSPRSCMT